MTNFSFDKDQFKSFNRSLKGTKTYMMQDGITNNRASLVMGRVQNGELPFETVLGTVYTLPQMFFVRALNANFDISKFNSTYLALPEFVNLRDLIPYFMDENVNVEFTKDNKILLITQKKDSLTISASKWKVILTEYSSLVKKVSGYNYNDVVELLPIDALKKDNEISIEYTYHIESGTFATLIKPALLGILKLFTRMALLIYQFVNEKLQPLLKKSSTQVDHTKLGKHVQEQINLEHWDFMELSSIVEYTEFEWWASEPTRLELFLQGEPFIPRISITDTQLSKNNLQGWQEKRRLLSDIKDYIDGLKILQTELESIKGNNQLKLHKYDLIIFPGLDYLFIGQNKILPPVSIKPYLHIGDANVAIIPIRGDATKKLKSTYVQRRTQMS
jgi:hypothetical protein